MVLTLSSQAPANRASIWHRGRRACPSPSAQTSHRMHRARSMRKLGPRRGRAGTDTFIYSHTIAVLGFAKKCCTSPPLAARRQPHVAKQVPHAPACGPAVGSRGASCGPCSLGQPVPCHGRSYWQPTESRLFYALLAATHHCPHARPTERSWRTMPRGLWFHPAAMYTPISCPALVLWTQRWLHFCGDNQPLPPFLWKGDGTTKAARRAPFLSREGSLGLFLARFGLKGKPLFVLSPQDQREIETEGIPAGTGGRDLKDVSKESFTAQEMLAVGSPPTTPTQPRG